jgi:UDP:flavonoid glycosyltransferase YjiC (YdhE family)
VRTTAPEWLFADLPRPVHYARQAMDVGIIQPDSLRMDLAATLAACQDLHGNFPRLLDQELNYIRSNRIDLIVGDIPPACFEVAARAEIPSIAVTNFTWDVMYRAYMDEYPRFAPLIEEMSRWYTRATTVLALPYACEMSLFRRQEAIPWIARCSSLTREEARARFGLPESATLVLLSFGGIGLAAFPLDRLHEMTEFYFVATGAGESRANVQVLQEAQHHYHDLLRAVDVVVTKPGYGIVADVLAQKVPMLYTDRGNFPEYPYLLRALNDLATAEFIPQDEVRSGNLRPYLNRLLDKAPHWPEAPLDGAPKAAEKLLTIGSALP